MDEGFSLPWWGTSTILTSLYALFQSYLLLFHAQLDRDVYRIESIVSYRYHKTVTGIVSKWQINDTYNDTFYNDINIKDRASLAQKLMFFFFIKCMFCFSFSHHMENYGPWIVLYCMLSIPKGKKWTVWLHFIPKYEIIFVYTVKYVNI